MARNAIADAALAVLLAIFSSGAMAQQPYGMNVSVEIAKKPAAAAVAEARKNNWFMALAVTDPAGTVV